MILRSRISRFCLLALVLIVAGGGLWLKACFGPETAIVFTWERHPDLPLDRFAAGRVGVLQPYYARSYLVVAYRYLAGRPLSREEQVEAVDLWQRRLNGSGEVAFDQEEAGPVPGVAYLQTPSPDVDPDSQALPDTWLAARSEFLKGPPPTIHQEERRWEQMQWFQNIQKGAFRLALRTLRDRQALWGKHDPRLLAWIQAQDQVFTSTREHPALPAPLPASADPLLKKDRAYQIAAATFYAQQYDQASTAFGAIASDAGSPWAKVAAYLVARCSYQKGMALAALPGQEQAARKAFAQALAQAEQASAYVKAYTLALELRWKVKQDQASASATDPDFDQDARYLAKAAAAADHPVERTRELAGLLGKRDGTPDFGVDLGDYTILLDRRIENEEAWDDYLARTDGWAKPPEHPRTITASLLEDDLTDWVFHFRETGASAFTYAGHRWQERKTVPWLLAALANAEPGSPGVKDLLAAAQALPETHPGYPMASFHRARLLAALGQPDEARRGLDRLVSLGAEVISPSALNLAKTVRLPLARSRGELLEDLLRPVVGVDYPAGEGLEPERTETYDLRLVASGSVAVGHAESQALLKAYGAQPTFLQADGATLLNLEVPTTVLVELAMAQETPAHLKREWLRCAWARAALLGDNAQAGRIAPEVQKTEPELAQAMAEYLGTPEAGRPRAALWILLHNPGLRWYVSQSLSSRTYLPTRHAPNDWGHGYRLQDRHPFRDSFWPSLKDLQEQKWSGFWFGTSSPFPPGPALARVTGGRPAQPPGFLTPAEKASLNQEAAALKTLEDGPTWLCKRVLAWAKAAPEDAQVPEALHLAVRATRIGGATSLSKVCFRLLHDRYGKTTWAAKTPYYF